ncbi:MAG TPA: response regulator transcription factor [Thermoguttaceae bacterium]|nr:response regulator transcription factor [Thermoguttaceae bacterium]
MNGKEQDDSTGRKHLLVIEDEEHLATGIKYNLDAEGYRVTTVGDGPSAMEIIREDPHGVDLVILDLMLPGMSGYAVCEALRALDRDLPVLILSARTLAEDRARGFDVGANQYMTKPFDLDEFLSRVKNLLTFHNRRRESASAAAGPITSFEFAGSRINFKTFQVTTPAGPVRMTQMEMTLLRYFIENEGRVIPRQELLENVWGMSGNVQTRAPDQFIRRLRKTFEPDPARPRHFLTIRDAGYRFVAKGK